MSAIEFLRRKYKLILLRKRKCLHHKHENIVEAELVTGGVFSFVLVISQTFFLEIYKKNFDWSKGWDLDYFSFRKTLLARFYAVSLRSLLARFLKFYGRFDLKLILQFAINCY
jgi:hypothetical protein